MFSKLLNEDFSSYLRLSKEDLGNAQELFAHRNVITVIGPNGIKYDIGTKMSREEVILKKGWAEFSRAHHLCNTDKLIFTCGCHGCFSVLIFDKNGMLVEKRLGPSEVEEDEITLGHRNDKEAWCQSKKEKVIASRSRHPRKRKDEIVSGHKNRKDKEGQCQSKKQTVVASSSTLPRKRKGKSHEPKHKHRIYEGDSKAPVLVRDEESESDEEDLSWFYTGALKKEPHAVSQEGWGESSKPQLSDLAPSDLAELDLIPEAPPTPVSVHTASDATAPNHPSSPLPPGVVLQEISSVPSSLPTAENTHTDAAPQSVNSEQEDSVQILSAPPYSVEVIAIPSNTPTDVNNPETDTAQSPHPTPLNPALPCTDIDPSKLSSFTVIAGEEDGIQSKKGKAVDKEVQSQGKKEKAVASSSRLARKRKEISDTSDSSDSEIESQHTIVARLRKTFFSQRRLITEVEKKETLKEAQGFKSSRPYFLKKMKKSSVYKDLFVVVPIKFARANLPNHATQISLQVSSKTEKWEVSCRYRMQKAGKQHVWIISGGWWQFSFANNLEEGDTLVFEMMKKNKIQLENHKIEMKVHIFRVVKDIKNLKVI